MAIRSKLEREQGDAETAAQSALLGQSLTGYSGRHTDISEGPIVAERLEMPSPVENADMAAPRMRDRAPEPVRERVPFGEAEMTLAVPPQPGYRLYWFNDTPGRIQRAKLAGYEHVIDPETGDPVQQIVGKGETGRGQNAYLMRIPLKWYSEDMARQQAELDRRLSDIKQGRKGSDVTVESGYVPSQGIHISR